MITPRRLKPGHNIAIVAPASPVNEEEIRHAVTLIERRGYRVTLGKHLLDTMDSNDYLAGTDSARADDINEMFARQDVDGIFCARGGYGCMRMWNRINWDVVRANPKPFTGYSDITSLHLAISQMAGFVTFYGPNATSLRRLDPLSSQQFWQMLEEPTANSEIPSQHAPVRCLFPGTVEGELTGGCISLLAHACGSRYTPSFSNKIVILEDVGEAIYRMDRYLSQLLNAGAFDDALGFIVGTVTNWENEEKKDEKKEKPRPNSLDALWKEFFGSLAKPTIIGFPFGHEPNPLTLPLGCRAILDASNCRLTLTTPPVS